MRRLAALLAVVALTGGLTGCSGGSDEAGGPTATPSAPVGASPTPAPPAPRLSVAQAQKVLVTAADLPAGWAASADQPQDTTRDEYDPKACAVLASGAVGSPLARASFTQAGDKGGSLVQTVYRPSGRSPAQLLEALRAATSKCASHQVQRSDVITRATVAAATFPNLGDGTYAVTLQYAGAMIGVVDLVVQVAVGPQVLRFDSISIGATLPQADLEKAVRAAVDRVRAA